MQGAVPRSHRVPCFSVCVYIYIYLYIFAELELKKTKRCLRLGPLIISLTQTHLHSFKHTQSCTHSHTNTWWLFLYSAILRSRADSLRSHVILHAHTHTHTHNHSHTRTYRNTHTYTHSQTHKHSHISTHTNTDAHTHTYMHKFTHTCVHSHKHTYTNRCTPPPPQITQSFNKSPLPNTVNFNDFQFSHKSKIETK